MVVHYVCVASGSALFGRSPERRHRPPGRGGLDLERLGRGHVLRCLLRHRRVATSGDDHHEGKLQHFHIDRGHDLLLASRCQECWRLEHFRYMVVHHAGSACFVCSRERSHQRSAHADSNLERLGWGHVLRRLPRHGGMATPGDQYEGN